MNILIYGGLIFGIIGTFVLMLLPEYKYTSIEVDHSIDLEIK